MRLAITLCRNIFLGIVVLLALALAANALTYSNFDPQYGFLRLKQQAVATGWYLPAYYSHVLIGGIILVLGFFQLHPKSIQRFRKLHRVGGYIYVMGILFFAAPGGIVMSLFVDRGPWVLTSFLLQGSLWFLFTALAFDRIRKRDITAHRQWMWRSYALTFAAITLRIYIFISSYSYNLSVPQAYATLAWLSWVPNLVVAEIYLRTSASMQRNNVSSSQ
jgi:hypothetical protein